MLVKQLNSAICFGTITSCEQFDYNNVKCT